MVRFRGYSQGYGQVQELQLGLWLCLGVKGGLWLGLGVMVMVGLGVKVGLWLGLGVMVRGYSQGYGQVQELWLGVYVMVMVRFRGQGYGYVEQIVFLLFFILGREFQD